MSDVVSFAEQERFINDLVSVSIEFFASPYEEQMEVMDRYEEAIDRMMEEDHQAYDDILVEFLSRIQEHPAPDKLKLAAYLHCSKEAYMTMVKH